jgi:hypothetical protein
LEVLPLEVKSDKRAVLSKEVLDSVLRFDPELGRFFWKVKRWFGGKAGDQAGSNHCGYRVIRFNGHTYSEHHLVWLHVYGEWPSQNLDHINRIRNDNRPENLRLASRAQNNINHGIRKDAKVRYKGVCYNPRLRKYVAQISLDKKVRHIGVYVTPEEAAHAYNCAAIQLHGEFAVLNPAGVV